MTSTWIPVCSGTALYNGNASASNMILTSKHCVTDLGASTASSTWQEYNIGTRIPQLCVQIDGQASTGCATSGAASSASSTPTKASRVHKVWAPADQNADWAIIQTLAPVETKPQVLAHVWNHNGTKWISQSAKDVTWSAMQTTSTFAMGFQKRDPSQPYGSSNPADLKWSYMSFATGTDPASFVYSNSYVTNHIDRGYATYLKPASGHLNATSLNGGGGVYSNAFTESGYGPAPRANALTGVLDKTTFPLAITFDGSTILGSVPDLTAANAVTTTTATSQEIVQWLNTAPGGSWSDFCSMHGWYHGYTCNANAVAFSMHGLKGSSYTTSNSNGVTVNVSLTDATGGSSVSTLASHVQNYWWTGSAYAYWFAGSFADGAALFWWIDPSTVSSPASSRDFTRNVKAYAFIDLPQLSSSGTFVEANNGAPNGHNLGKASGTGDSVSYLGQSCDARDANGKPCSTAPTLTCARTHDTGWGGRGKNYGSNSASYRCVLADPSYYRSIRKGCGDVWRGRTPNPGESYAALMYFVDSSNPTRSPTSAGAWERACIL